MRKDLIIAPITNGEKQELINMNMLDNVVVLYRTNKSNDIEIGMLAEAIRKYFPKLANLDKISEAYDLAFFVASNLDNISFNINDRPVYLIKPTLDRKVSEYQLLNCDFKKQNIWLEDILDGSYKPQEESFSFRNIM